MKENMEIVWMKRWFSHDSRGVSQMWYFVQFAAVVCSVVSLNQHHCRRPTVSTMYLNWFDLNWLHYKHGSVLTSVPLTVISDWSQLIKEKDKLQYCLLILRRGTKQVSQLSLSFGCFFYSIIMQSEMITRIYLATSF